MIFNSAILDQINKKMSNDPPPRLDSDLTMTEEPMPVRKEPILQRTVSFSDSVVSHSHDDWTARLAQHRQHKRKIRWHQDALWWNQFKSNWTRLLGSCGPVRRLPSDDMESMGILDDE